MPKYSPLSLSLYIYITDGNHIVLIHNAIWWSTVPLGHQSPEDRRLHIGVTNWPAVSEQTIFKICFVIYSGIVNVSATRAKVLLLNKYLKILSNKIYNNNTNQLSFYTVLYSKVTTGVLFAPMPPFVTTTGMLRSIRCHNSVFGITKVVKRINHNIEIYTVLCTSVICQISRAYD